MVGCSGPRNGIVGKWRADPGSITPLEGSLSPKDAQAISQAVSTFTLTFKSDKTVTISDGDSQQIVPYTLIDRSLTLTNVDLGGNAGQLTGSLDGGGRTIALRGAFISLRLTKVR